MQLAQVIIEHPIAPVDNPFDYLVPSGLTIVPHIRVIVPFNHQTVVGYVFSVRTVNQTLDELEQSFGFPLKSIVSQLDQEPILNDELNTLAQWLASTTISPLIAAYQALLPPALKPTSAKKVGIKMRTMVRIIAPYHDEGLTAKQKETYRLIASQPAIELSEIDSKAILQKLVMLGRVEKFSEEFYRDPYKEVVAIEPGPPLTEEQLHCLRAIREGQETVYLLEGITGSGKTEIYIHLALEALAQKKTFLLLVPEISLTPQMVRRFKQRIGEGIAVFHSALSPGEIYDEYRRIMRGEAKVVIGARSAVFVPLNCLAYIILDEEHSETYKQETAPLYHAREVALYRAQSHGAKVILGSATPSLESKARAIKGVYRNLFLTKRIGIAELPSATLINMLDEGRRQKNYGLFSHLLLAKIEEKLARNEQVLILLNRRGYAPFVTCRQCGYSFKCPACDVTLNYHKAIHSLKCHYCDHEEPFPQRCPQCQSTFLRTSGIGTQRVEEELKKVFPEAKIGRMDRDTVTKKNSHRTILDQFENHQMDLLIGTQMIAKGLDFPNVTLVGVIQADQGLSHGYRAAERTFQLITQVAGRSGRGTKKGETIIQTNNPDHYAIQLAANHDYFNFYQQEMEYRKLRHYPPYRYLVKLLFEGKNMNQITDMAFSVKQQIQQLKLPNVEVLGPTVPYLATFQQRLRMTLLIKYFQPQSLHSFLHDLYRQLATSSSLHLTIDFDPYDE